MTETGRPESQRRPGTAGRQDAAGPVHAARGIPSGETGVARDLVEPDLPRTARERDGEELRTGWTTGTCATAATVAALELLVTGEPPREVTVTLPGGQQPTFPVERCVEVQPGTTEAVVVKDAGDDPDVTDGAELTATVAWADEPGVHLWGGDGVGVVTKPGLGLAVGGPAINEVPREMIDAAVRGLVDPGRRGVDVVVSVPEGEEMAKRTTNKRLGIVGGISILGTTGIVRPFSTASWQASVLQAIDVMAANAQSLCVLTTGGRTETAALRLLPDIDEVCVVEVGDFTGAAVRRCVERGLEEVLFVGMAGKLSKLGAGVMMTHYTRSRVDTGYLAEVTRRAGGGAALVDTVAEANTGRHAFEHWQAAGLGQEAASVLCRDVAANLRAKAEQEGGSLAAEAVLVEFDELTPVGWSDGAPRVVARLGGTMDPDREAGDG